MDDNTVQNSHPHFPIDKGSPVSEDMSFYNKNKRVIDLIVFLLISFSTVITVPLSLYIIFTKYL